MKNWICIFCFLFLSTSVFAQGEAIGNATSNYAGVNSVLLNPSAMHNQNTWFSFNLLSGNLFLHTDFIYLDKNEFQLRDLLDPNLELPMHSIPYGGEERAFYSYDRKKNTSVDQSMRILGPSIMLSFNQHAIAITSAARAQTNIRNLSPDLANLLANGFYFYPQHQKNYEVNNFSGSTMAWSEIGLSYAYRTDNRSYEGWSFGISLKRLIGAGGGYLDVKNSSYSLVNDSTIDIYSQQAEIGFSVPIDYNSNDYLPNSLFTGRGWGMDLGFTYQELLKQQPKLNASRFCEQEKNNYKYRIGVALLDIGSIAYKQNAQKHEFSTNDAVRGDIDDIVFENTNQAIGILNDRFYTASSSSFVENSIRIALPMALSVQADYNLDIANIYLNASLIYGIPLQGGALRRPNQFTFTPRYETRFVEVGLPLSMYQFQYPHIGAFARIGFLSIGSDWFSTLLGNQDFHGFDFYFSIKFQLEKGNCRTRKSNREGCGNKRGFPWAF